ncbi:MAG: DNA-binding protein, partial [Gammaproteobacteria bacterium]|nr:DNA-binding protein [Gammaproteobacteria bacterium]
FVYCVLNGQYKGHRGRSHEVAVKLGLKIVPHKQAA